MRDLDIGVNEKVGPCMMIPQEVRTMSSLRSEDKHDIVAEQGLPCDGSGLRDHV